MTMTATEFAPYLVERRRTPSGYGIWRVDVAHRDG